MDARRSKLTNLEQVLRGCQIPALPQSALKILELSKDPSAGPPEYALAIEADPGLAAQVLRFVNSSFFGFSREISNLRLAVTLVGVRTIKNFVLWGAVFTLLPSPRCGPFDLQLLRQDSFRRALFARTVARHLRFPEAEEVFLAALLQDMALPILAKQLTLRYMVLFEQRQTEGVPLSRLEESTFGWTHAQAGGMLARRWNLPENCAALIEMHNQFDQLSTCPEGEPGGYAVALSAVLPSFADEIWAEREQFLEAYALGQELGLPPAEELLQGVDEQFRELAPVLRIAVPPQTLIRCLNVAGAPRAQ
ncbi:MAG: HDOD domain-containing protein [Thermoguttaceae bacterium]|nr:HDOD domain-containing protein [Thermoguttaceae bacterium]MDW8080026.1 HDOD domain-containing protein [Thermoguttaceae bacterium]